MRVLVTGVSSLSGARICAALAEGGHEVHAAVRGTLGSYAGLRGERLRSLAGSVDFHAGVSHDDPSLAALVRAVRPDVVAYHAHPMTGFRGADYDALAAAREMTAELDDQLAALAETGASVICTGTVYEPGPVEGPVSHPALSPYGLSKSVVFETVRMRAAGFGVPVFKFVIPNPYGPLEEGRFGNHLASVWGKGDTPVVRTPNLVRDNIPVQELARRFAAYVGAGPERPRALRPSGYIEAQGRFAQRVAAELATRLGRSLPLEYLWDAVASEPPIVVNDTVPAVSFKHHESGDWDEYAEWMAREMRAAAR